jgi:hypothetical protein
VEAMSAVSIMCIRSANRELFFVLGHDNAYQFRLVEPARCNESVFNIVKCSCSTLTEVLTIYLMFPFEKFLFFFR